MLDNHYLKDTEGELERIKKEINNFRKSKSEDISAMVICLLNLKNCFERAGGDMDEDMFFFLKFRHQVPFIRVKKPSLGWKRGGKKGGGEGR